MESPPTTAPINTSANTTSAALLGSQDTSSLVNLLSKVDVSPADLLSALSKVQGQSRVPGKNKETLASLKAIYFIQYDTVTAAG